MDNEAPIFQFLRWLRQLGVLEWFILLVLAPSVGVISVVVPAMLWGGRRPYPGGLLRNSVENMAVSITVLCLLVFGAMLTLASRRLGLFATITTMSVFVVWALLGALMEKEGHNMLPFELLVYLALTGIAILGGSLATKLRRRVARG